MKKNICLIMIALMIFSLAACSDGAVTGTTEVVGTTAADDNAATQAPDNAASNTSDDAGAKKTDGVDVDLTTMSSTMVYSEVQNMQQTPEKYLGKIVKMHGPFSVTELNGNRYFACIIKDATACCSTGIEFDLAGDYSYPDDYPKKDTEITVIGTFTTYMEGQNKYLQLKEAEIIS